ncbi:MAG TPA: hypothetical protein PKO09_16910 [Anaerolineae bacterium]|nr:hypothetical protein [Anaerolineae bacterium]
MNKGMGYALGFLLVLLVVALGFYVAYTSFQSSRAALLFEPTVVPRTSTPTRLPTTAPISTPIPSPSATLTVTLPVTPTAVTSATPHGQAEATAVLAEPDPSLTPAPPTATVPSASSFAFRLAGPPAPEHTGDCCYIRGTVRDAAGNGLQDIVLQMTDDWGNLYSATTKAGSEAGLYDFPLSLRQQAFTYRLKIVDAQGAVISTQVEVTFDPAVAPSYRVDWKRSY